MFVAQFEQLRGTTAYKLPNYNKAKRLWKLAVEHHAFFRYTVSVFYQHYYCDYVISGIINSININ